MWWTTETSLFPTLDTIITRFLELLGLLAGLFGITLTL